VGNRTNRTSTISQLPAAVSSYNANDLLASDGNDNNGNTTASGANAYQYDALDHLTNVNSGQILLGYDGDGNRVSKKVGGVTTYYLVDDRNPTGYAQVVEEWAGSGTPALSRVYNYGLALVSQVVGTATTYFVTDGHGSTRLLLDNSANVLNAFAYDAYGTLIASNAVSQTAYLYCGQQFDTDLGFYYLRARYYKPDTGRFWTMDRFEGDQEDPVSLHKYLYGDADPVNNFDPLGMSADDIAFGRAVEQVIRRDFYYQDRLHRGARDTALSTLVGGPYGGSLRGRVDLYHKDGRDNFFFEIKHLDPTEIARGLKQVERYNRILNHYNCWRPGTCLDYCYWPANGGPLIYNDVNGKPLPGGYIALVVPPVGGVITYIKMSSKVPAIFKTLIVATLATMRVQGAATVTEAATVTAEAAEVAQVGATASAIASTGTAAGYVGAGAAADIGVGVETVTDLEVMGGP
jgi:RHS repeat-associated protein